MSDYNRWSRGIDYLDLAVALGLNGSASLAGQFYCCCPLHSERHPSFSLNINDGRWYCHTEQRGGGFDALVSEIMGVDRMAARSWILEHASQIKILEPADTHVSPERSPSQGAIDRYYSLPNTSLPTWWFEERGFDWDVADKWGVKYDPTAQQLHIPVRVPRDGDVVAVIIRNMINRPKYLNSPGLDRRNILFGYDPQPSSKTILLTEGPLDVMRAEQAGIGAMALLGSTFSDEHIRMLRQIPNVVYVIGFDNPDLDEAGRRVSHALADRLEHERMVVQMFTFPTGTKDIGECSPEQVVDGIRAASDPILTRRF